MERPPPPVPPTRPPPPQPPGTPSGWGTGGHRPTGLTGLWWRFRAWPIWVQVLLWSVLWPVLGAFALLARPQKAAWQLVAAVVLLVVVAPAWAVAWIAPQAAGERVAAAEGPDGGVDEEPISSGEPGDGGSEPASGAVAGDLEVHFVDVGQADATLLLHEEVAVLIDAGHWQRSDVVPYLRDQGIAELDLVIITHPHADHIGQFDQVIDAFDVTEVWWSGSQTTTQTFSRAVDALDRSGALYEEPRAGDRTSIGPLSFDILNPPVGTDLSDLHDASLSITITYGEVALLFTGDAEAATEQRMVSAAVDGLRADILQLGHHGSSTSTTAPFLSAVDPAVGIYSAGSGNQYGHPHAEVIDRLQAADVETYGTDVHGHVIVTTDGSSWTVTTDRSGSVPAVPAPDGSGDEARAPPGSEEAPDEEAPATSEGCEPGQVDINSAGVEELEQIVHIGSTRAQEMIGLRRFANVDSMTRISGIAAGRLADIKQEGLACVG